MPQFILPSGGVSDGFDHLSTPAAGLPTPPVAGFRLRLALMDSNISATFNIAWARGNGVQYGGCVSIVAAHSLSSGASDIVMLSGDLGWGTIQIVEVGLLMALELVADGSWGYDSTTAFTVTVQYATGLSTQYMELLAPVEGLDGTVMASTADTLPAPVTPAVMTFINGWTASTGVAVADTLNWVSIAWTLQRDDADAVFLLTTTGLQLVKAGMYNFTWTSRSDIPERTVWVGLNRLRLTHHLSMPSGGRDWISTYAVTQRIIAGQEFRIIRTGGANHPQSELSFSCVRLGD